MTETATKTFFGAVGRRKTASARVRLCEGTGEVTINGHPILEYFKTEAATKMATGPLATADVASKVDVVAKVIGGGPNGQAGAVAHGIARALLKFNPELRKTLKVQGHLTRDPRERERKKPGRPGARRRFQFSKR